MTDLQHLVPGFLVLIVASLALQQQQVAAASSGHQTMIQEWGWARRLLLDRTLMQGN